MTFFQKSKKGLLLKVHIQPKAKEDKIVGLYGEEIKIKLKAPPEKGRANKALKSLLSSYLKITKKDIEIVKGEQARKKILLLKGIDSEELKKKISPFL